MAPRSNRSFCLQFFLNALTSNFSELYRSKTRKNMEKFPEDVVIAERRTDGDPNIIRSEEFQPVTRPNIASIFGDNTTKVKKGRGGRRKTSRPNNTELQSYARTAKRNQTPIATSTPTVTPGRANYTTYGSTPSRSYGTPSATNTNRTPASAASSGEAEFKCHHCNFSTNRLNVIIFHNRTHSSEKKPAAVVETPPPGKLRAHSAICFFFLVPLSSVTLYSKKSRYSCGKIETIFSVLFYSFQLPSQERRPFVRRRLSQHQKWSNERRE